MTAYKRLIRAERDCHTIEVMESATGKPGAANSEGPNVAVFYGADDGSDDAVFSPAEFNERFIITAEISG